jgi:hypothetical protein
MIQSWAIGATVFTQQNIDKIRMKMSAAEVEKLFGVADEVESAVCGRSTKNAWVCETWKYKMPNSSEMNEFIFYVDDKGKILDQWRVKRAPVKPQAPSAGLDIPTDHRMLVV